jgi:hypothetical protein
MIAAAATRVRANLSAHWAGLARGLFALYLLLLVAWGSQPDTRGQSYTSETPLPITPAFSGLGIL